jgi:hypothetical protein
VRLVIFDLIGQKVIDSGFEKKPGKGFASQRTYLGQSAAIAEKANIIAQTNEALG